MEPVYLDYNATTPIDREVAEAMKPYLFEFYGNPSSDHQFGVLTKRAVIAAREQVASLIHCHEDEIIFTSGGTESNNLAIKGIAYASRNKGRHILTTSVEHPAVTEVCRFLEQEGYQVTYLPVDGYGMVNVEVVQKNITPETILISVMHANNEVGTVQPVEEIGQLARRYKIPFHTDAAQSTGKIQVDVNNLGVDLLSVAGHKLYAPKGIGALFVRRGTPLQKLMHGADHEMNRRAGTENVLEIVGLGKACEIAARDLELNIRQMKLARNRLYEGIVKEIPDAKLNGHPDIRLPNTLSLSFPGVEANTLLSELTEVAASAGAACHTDSVDISPVLTAMKIPTLYAMGTIRFSTGKNTTEAEIDKAISAVSHVVKRLRTENLTGQGQVSQTIRLTQFTHGMGCACKIRPQYLEQVLKGLSVSSDPNVLVSLATSDDAAVYRINETTAIIQTVDFFTPVVDDPYHFGAIAAANALSDVYAMGGTPLFALNIAGFPDNRLPMQVLKDILQGAQDKAEEAGISILGGHTVEDTEPKFGMTVTGIAHPDKIMTNDNLRPGDVLVLTKPIGTGIIATAVKRGLAEPGQAEKAIQVMSQLNKTAAEIMKRFPVNACTDVTGFGLLGHLKEMTISSGMDVEIYSGKIPLIDGVEKLAANGIIPGGTRNNLDFVEDVMEWGTGISEMTRLIISDAQTSGGLLISLSEKHGQEMVNSMIVNDLSDVAIIGKVLKKGVGKISLI
jgi:cysteine desulfurase